MLWTIMIVLAVLWAVGLIGSFTLGGFIHVLIIAAIALLVVQLVLGRRRAAA